MIFPLILFIVSGLTLITMLVSKRLELTHGRGLIVLDMLSDFDHWATGSAERTKAYLSLVNKKNTFTFLNSIFVFSVRVLLAIIEWMRDIIHSLYEKVARRERPGVKAGASSSLFLKRVSEVKEDKRDDSVLK